MDFLRRVSESLSLTDKDGVDGGRQTSADSGGGDPRKSSFSNFDLDQTTPVSPSKIDPSTMFDDLKPQTPAGRALRANKELRVSRVDKLTNKIIKKRPKLKNLTKDVKKSRRRRRSQIKGKKIDGRHEQYALSIGMMLGIRVCVGKSEQVKKCGRRVRRAVVARVHPLLPIPSPLTLIYSYFAPALTALEVRAWHGHLQAQLHGLHADR